jgi:hypothetical protein
LLKEDVRLFALGIFALRDFGFGNFCFWAERRLCGFWMKGGFLMWEALERKRIPDGKMIAEGK